MHEDSEIDSAETDDGGILRNTPTDDESEQNNGYHQFHLVNNNGEMHEAINYKKWSRHSSVSQSTDATLTTGSTRSLETVLENTEPLEMSMLALDNLSKYKRWY